MEIGAAREQAIVGVEAAIDILRRISAVHAQDQVPGARFGQFGGGGDHLGCRDVFVEFVWINGDRIVTNQHVASLMIVDDVDGLQVEIDGDFRQVLVTRGQEVVHVARRLKTNDVGAQQPVEEFGAQVDREEAPSVRGGPWNVGEMQDRRGDARLAQHCGDQVELVVMHHQSVRVVLGCGCGGHRRVVATVCSPRCARVVADDRRLAQVVELVLDKPEQRIRDLVVGPVEVRRVWLGEVEQERVAGSILFGDCVTPLLACDCAILGGHCAGDPRHPMRAHEATQRRDQATTGTTGDALSVHACVGDRATVRNDRQPAFTNVKHRTTVVGVGWVHSQQGLISRQFEAKQFVRPGLIEHQTTAHAICEFGGDREPES